jgi:hypothetical protein|nr:SIR2 family protein [Kofleriaceae bacterium]
MAGERSQALQNALLQAFANEDELRLLVSRLDTSLDVITAPKALPIMMLNVIEHFDSRGLLEKLVEKARDLRPHNQGFVQVVREHWPGLLGAGTRPSTNAVARREALREQDWEHLIGHIHDRRVTPVIGPDVSRGVLPSLTELAGEWAERWHYPFADRDDVAKVAQFLALREYRLLPHEQIQHRIANVRLPSLDSHAGIHGVLADLNLPLYLTTCYDGFMLKALNDRRHPATHGYPVWNQTLREQSGNEAGPTDSGRSSLVYHLFGHHEIAESMVVTEDDHFEFLTAVVADPKLFPPIVKRALSTTSLLFVGYSVLDFGFRVLLRALLKSVSAKNPRLGVAVQLPPESLSDEQRAQVEKYLKAFLNEPGQFRFNVFWGDTLEFTRSLRDRLALKDRNVV